MVAGKLSLRRLLAVLAAGLALAGCAASPPPATAPQQTGNASDARVISFYWEGDASIDRSSIDFLGRTPSGERFRAAVSRPNDSCDIRYSLNWHKVGSWALWCDSGRTASGAFRTLGGGKGSFGWGEDDRGHQVRYVVHDRDGAIEDGLQVWLIGAPPVWH